MNSPDYPGSGLRGRDAHLGVQRAMNRAALGHLQEPGALLAGELAVELQFALDMVQLAGPGFAVRAVPGVDALMTEPDRDVPQRPSLAVGVHAHRNGGAGRKAGPEQVVGGGGAVRAPRPRPPLRRPHRIARPRAAAPARAWPTRTPGAATAARSSPAAIARSSSSRPGASPGPQSRLSTAMPSSVNPRANCAVTGPALPSPKQWATSTTARGLPSGISSRPARRSPRAPVKATIRPSAIGPPSSSPSQGSPAGGSTRRGEELPDRIGLALRAPAPCGP